MTVFGIFFVYEPSVVYGSLLDMVDCCDGLFLACIVFHVTAGDGSKKIKGCWDSIHVIEVQVCV